MRVLCIGDVSGDPGLEFLRRKLPGLKREKRIDFCIVNGENARKGNGISPNEAKDIFSWGADVITTGNHVFQYKEIYEYLDNEPLIIRPGNFSPSAPGKGYCIADIGKYRIGVINVSGSVFLEAGDPFPFVDEAVKALSECKVIICDIHAEATGEKLALAHYLDGRVSAVFGTHTHVQTSDEQILPGGTGYITDLGMTGSAEGILGVRKEAVIRRLKTGLPTRFESAEGACHMGGCIFDIDPDTGKTTKTERIYVR